MLQAAVEAAGPVALTGDATKNNAWKCV
jgi:hypothetical protein